MRSYSVEKPIIIKAHAVKYFTNLASHQPLQNRTIPLTFRNANICMCRYAFTSALSLASHHHTCLPCQREVDWRHDTNFCLVASCLRYAHHFYIVNFSAVKTEGLQYLPHPFRFSDTSVNNPSVTVTENVILRQHIFYFNIKQYWKTTCFTVPAPFTQGS